MSRILKVGIIGASARGGWAKESHVQAVNQLNGLELTAVATRNQQSADEAAKAFGAKKAYADTDSLLHDPEIDIVTIAVKVPDHRELVLSALQAGKHVFCEWPLGKNIAEAEEMHQAAVEAGVHTAIGLQSRTSPAFHTALQLFSSGKIGRPLCARILSGTVGWGPKTDQANLYLENEEEGATLFTIHVGHAIDFAGGLLGEATSEMALGTNQYPQYEVTDSGEKKDRTIPDHWLIQTDLHSGASLSVEVLGGVPPDSRFRFEIMGDKGLITIGGGAPRGFQSERLTVSVNGKPQLVEEGELASLPDTAVNVGAMYAAFRQDILSNQFTVPDFAHAVRLTKLLDDINASFVSGQRRQIDYTLNRAYL